MRRERKSVIFQIQAWQDLVTNQIQVRDRKDFKMSQKSLVGTEVSVVETRRLPLTESETTEGTRLQERWQEFGVLHLRRAALPRGSCPKTLNSGEKWGLWREKHEQRSSEFTKHFNSILIQRITELWHKKSQIKRNRLRETYYLPTVIHFFWQDHVQPINETKKLFLSFIMGS